MKKCLSLLLVLAIVCGLAASVSAEQPKTYALGDKMDDFSVTLSDGTEVSLYHLLAEKRAVLINFWASWCSPCKREFPAMEQAYREASDQIGIIALSCEKTDTDEIVLSLKEELGLEELPMGLDNGLSGRFALEGYPTSVLVDRNGVICFMEAGSIPDKGKFLRLFDLYTGDDYSESVITREIPMVKRDVDFPSVQALAEALDVTDERITFTIPTDETVWPFVPDSEDGLRTSNDAVQLSTALLPLTVEAEAGEALAYDYALSCPAVLDSLSVTVDGELAQYYGGEAEWTDDYVTFGETGTHTVEFAFTRGTSTVEEAGAMLRGLRILPREKAEALDAVKTVYPKTLSGTECSVEPLAEGIREVVFTGADPSTGAVDETPVDMAPAGPITLRVQIGADVDERVAYIADSTHAVLLANLPYDEQGFLFEGQIAEATPNTTPYSAFVVSSSAVDQANAYTVSYSCLASEADADAYVAMVKELAASFGVTDYQMTWAYADGSPKLSEAAQPAAETRSDGMADYVVRVTDEAGAPVAGAMIQICDPETCMVAVTDQDGIAPHTAKPYPYEIHVLKAPDGFIPDAQVYVMPEAGGEITIVLKK